MATLTMRGLQEQINDLTSIWQAWDYHLMVRHR